MKLTDDTRLPLFVIPGMPRAGTTFLYHNLQNHPQIFLTYRKEIDYFTTIYRHRGVRWYHSLFKEIRDGQVAGDISPAMWYEPNAIAYIKEYNPAAKIIISVRDPAVFTVSLWMQKRITMYDVPDSLETFMDQGYDSKLTRDGAPVRFSFDDAIYINTIESYKAAFGSQLMLYDFDFFKKNQLAAVNAIEDFLGISRYFNAQTLDNRRINESMRRGIKWLENLGNQEWVRDVFERYVPRRLTMRIRSAYDRLSVSSRPEDNARQVHQAEAIEAARKRLPQSSAYYRGLFKDHPVVDGTGKAIALR